MTYRFLRGEQGKALSQQLVKGLISKENGLLCGSPSGLILLNVMHAYRVMYTPLIVNARERNLFALKEGSGLKSPSTTVFFSSVRIFYQTCSFYSS